MPVQYAYVIYLYIFTVANDLYFKMGVKFELGLGIKTRITFLFLIAVIYKLKSIYVVVNHICT